MELVWVMGRPMPSPIKRSLELVYEGVIKEMP